MKIKAIFIIVFSVAQLSAFCQTASDSLTLKLENLAKHNSVQGFGVAIYTKDSVLYKSGFGFADVENNNPYTTQTVQKIASISKLLLGVSIMKAQEMNLLHLDDNVNDYLPFKLINPNFPKQVITIRHLATHTAGLKKLPEYDLKALYFPTPIPKIKDELPFGLRRTLLNKLSKRINKNEDVPLNEFLQNLYDPNGKWYNKNHFENVKAGEKEVYSNEGASLLALIIEKASGVSYSEFVQTHILSALQMNNSGFDFNMQGYLKDKKSSLYHAGIKVPNNYKLILYPAGGFETSIDDFNKFMQSMASGYNEKPSILTTASFNEMLKAQIKPEFEHGILWEVYPSSTVGHEGDIVGVLTYAYYNKKQARGYMLFCNTSTTKTIYKDTNEIIETLKNYYGKLAP
ncbi:serine hydrolase domain-containing protein [Aureibaculum luteum]|uniref:serine hydrolase domain-containing protein n=1 Tax=Aureibaculum luteum TaxID=1548456 RepID=UPI000E493147|nr:serine hydrolase domain-containing protein [Aureibaculum luteum]